jgi:hypothetical protein
MTPTVNDYIVPTTGNQGTDGSSYYALQGVADPEKQARAKALQVERDSLQMHQTALEHELRALSMVAFQREGGPCLPEPPALEDCRRRQRETTERLAGIERQLKDLFLDDIDAVKAEAPKPAPAPAAPTPELDAADVRVTLADHGKMVAWINVVLGGAVLARAKEAAAAQARVGDALRPVREAFEQSEEYQALLRLKARRKEQGLTAAAAMKDLDAAKRAYEEALNQGNDDRLMALCKKKARVEAILADATLLDADLDRVVKQKVAECRRTLTASLDDARRGLSQDIRGEYNAAVAALLKEAVPALAHISALAALYRDIGRDPHCGGTGALGFIPD